MRNKYLKNLSKIEFVVTNTCSGRCKHCSQGEHTSPALMIDPEASREAVKKIAAEYDIAGRGLKAQMKYANKINAKKMIVLGDNEVNSGTATIKNMFTGEENLIYIDPARLAAALEK